VKTFESFSNDILGNCQNKNQTYIKMKFKNFLSEIDNVKLDSILKRIKEYDVVNNFTIKETYQIEIVPDDGFIVLIRQLNEFIDDKIPLDIKFEVSLVNMPNLLNHLLSRHNLIEFKNGIPKSLRNLGVGYKIYKIMINKFDYITSNKDASEDAINIWYFLMLDTDLYCYTSNTESGVILKKSNKIKEFLEKIRGKDLIFDDQFQEKIIEIYGSVENYKNLT